MIKERRLVMEELKEYLPFLIPVVIVQFGLLFYTINHIMHHEKYKTGNRTLWLVITIIGMNFLGPILYFVFGKDNE